MTLRLHVDADRWRSHLRRTAAATSGLVPVAKGNGYGFGIEMLSREAMSLGADALAVGTYHEIDQAQGFSGTVLVLSPWRPEITTDLADDRLLHTVSRLDDLAALAAGPHRPRVVVEVLTSMHRHGIATERLDEVGPLLEGVRFEGWSFHLPLVGDTTTEAATLTGRAAAVQAGPAWVSHVPADRLAEVSDHVRSRVGTHLWLGDPEALDVRSTVLDVHQLLPGETFGYRQRSLRRGGTLVVVSGGTAHGIALTAPTSASTLRQRGIAVAEGGLEALGRARSPFVIDGRATWFAEPPHMQCSMVVLPASAPRPRAGDEVSVRVRHTIALVDEVVLH